MVNAIAHLQEWAINYINGVYMLVLFGILIFIALYKISPLFCICYILFHIFCSMLRAEYKKGIL